MMILLRYYVHLLFVFVLAPFMILRLGLSSSGTSILESVLARTNTTTSGSTSPATIDTRDHSDSDSQYHYDSHNYDLIQAINKLPINQSATDAVGATYVDPTVYLVRQQDFIYRGNRGEWGSSPIVIESHKLVFFPIPNVGDDIWMELFERIMMKHLNDTTTRSSSSSTMRGLKHNSNQHKSSSRNNKSNSLRLKYLRDYPWRKANKIMSSPNYTRAIFVRDPKERFLAAYLNQALKAEGNYLRPLALGQKHCCFLKGQTPKECIRLARQSPQDFLEGFVQKDQCQDPHWRPQSQRMDEQYYQHLNFVGHWETIQQDAKTLLEKIDAWEEFGKTGWGPHGKSSIFATSTTTTTQPEEELVDREEMLEWFTPELEERVVQFYHADYDNPWLGLNHTSLFN